MSNSNKKKLIRSPIITVLGHVDAGKTSLLDAIRGTVVANKEAGGITQHIGATEVPIDIIINLAKPLLHIFKFEFKIPGLLFIDTPGHEAFTNLRKRGGSVANFAIIVVDVMKGLQDQTYEAIEICKEYKVPFIIAMNKIDRISGWIPKEGKPFLDSIKYQNPKVLQYLEEKLYNLVGQLYELGFEAERFDRVSDFKKQVAIVPISAKTREGLPELLLLVSGIVQKFLEDKLYIDPNSPGKGIILEKKEIRGLGDVIDVILYDGKISKKDKILFLGKDGPTVSKIKAILKPKPLQEIREKSSKFVQIEEAIAASGIRIVGDNIKYALAGSPLIVINKNIDEEKLKEELKQEVSEFLFETDKEGVVLKADTLGSLEAIVKMLKSRNIPVAKADIGNISKEDVIKVMSIKEKTPEYGVILGFNVGIEETAKDLIKNNNIPVILENVIYHLIEKLEEFISKKKEELSKSFLNELPAPAKIYIIPGNIFRRSNPAIVGVEVLGGELRPGSYILRKDGRILGKIESIQIEGKSVPVLKKGEKGAIAISGVLVGRHFDEGDVLYTYVDENSFKKYKQHKNLLSKDMKDVLKEIAKIMREKDPAWGL